MERVQSATISVIAANTRIIFELNLEWSVLRGTGMHIYLWDVPLFYLAFAQGDTYLLYYVLHFFF